MILLTRLNGGEFALNPDLIERADTTPDTVITLTDGTKYVVAESVRELTAKVRDFRASTLARAHAMEEQGTYASEDYVRYEADDAQHDESATPEGGDNVRVLRPLRGL